MPFSTVNHTEINFIIQKPHLQRVVVILWKTYFSSFLICSTLQLYYSIPIFLLFDTLFKRILQSALLRIFYFFVKGYFAKEFVVKSRKTYTDFSTSFHYYCFLLLILLKRCTTADFKIYRHINLHIERTLIVLHYHDFLSLR